MRIKLAIVSAIVLLGGCSATTDRTAETVHPVPATTAGDPEMTSIHDCEDLEASTPVTASEPCMTYDEGEWRVVRSYAPYTAEAVAECGAEDGGPILPCVWTKHRNKRTNGWNYFTK
jgi:hypothetical protein